MLWHNYWGKLFNKPKQIVRTVNVTKISSNSYIDAEITSENGKILSEVIDLIKINEEAKVIEKLELLSINVTDINKIVYRKIGNSIYLWINN